MAINALPYALFSIALVVTLGGVIYEYYNPPEIEFEEIILPPLMEPYKDIDDIIDTDLPDIDPLEDIGSFPEEEEPPEPSYYEADKPDKPWPFPFPDPVPVSDDPDPDRKSDGVNPLAKNYREMTFDCDPNKTSEHAMKRFDYDNDSFREPVCYWVSPATKVLFIDAYDDMTLRNGWQLGHVENYTSVFDLLEMGICEHYECYWWKDRDANVQITELDALEPFDDKIDWYENYSELTPCEPGICTGHIIAIGQNTDNEHIVDFQIRYWMKGI